MPELEEFLQHGMARCVAILLLIPCNKEVALVSILLAVGAKMGRHV